MSAPVTCPSCRSAVSIPADHAEPTIRCGICWAEVAVGARVTAPAKPVVAPPPPAPVVAVATKSVPELPGRPLPGMVKLEERMRQAAARIAPPPAPAAPVRAAVVAKPALPLVEIAPAVATVAPAIVEPMPIAELSEDDDRPARPSRTRGSRRREREDHDDDFDRTRRRHRETPKGNPLPLILGIVGTILLLVGGVYLIARATRGTSDRDIVPIAADGNNPPVQFNLPNMDPNPAPAPAPPVGFNPFPNMPNRPAPAPRPQDKFPDLVVQNGDGFSAKCFAQKIETPFTTFNLYDDAYLIAHARGKRLASNSFPPVASIEVTTADVPKEVTPDLKRMVAETVFRRGEVQPVKFAGHDGFEIVDDFAGRKTKIRAVQVGCRIFLVKFTINGSFGDAAAAEKAQNEFFDSFTITFDANTPPPAAGAGLVPRNRLPVPRPPTPPKLPRPKLPGQP